MAACVFAVLFLLAAGAAAGPLTTSRLRVQHMDTPTVEAGQPILFSWVPEAVDRDVVQGAFHLRLREAGGATVFDSGKLASSDFQLRYSGAHLRPAARYEWALQWWSQHGMASTIATAAFRTSIDWTASNSSWLDGQQNMLRKDFTVASPPTDATVSISGVGFFQLYVNGLRIDPATLNGAWTTYNKRVLAYTYDVTHTLKVGKNAIGVMLGHGWRDVGAFPPHPSNPCDRYERLVRAQIDVNGQTIVVTDNSWQGTTLGPVLSDSVYNGETYDARREQPGWDGPGFRPPTAWTSASVVSCFNPVQTPASFPAIGVVKENKPVKITTLTACAGGQIGGLVDENSNLTLQCAPNSGLIQDITFASFGTPSGSCGAYTTGSCNAKSSLEAVRALCVGKLSCVIPATNDFFGGDPCFDVAKALAVSASGCKPVSRFVVDFGENLSGWVRLRVKGTTGTTVIMRHAEVLQHPPYGPVDGNIYTGNLRSALATDTYTLRGDASGEIYEPHFTYHGFQFVEVNNYPGILTADNITQVHFHTLVDERVKFNSSSPVLNHIQYNAIKGQGSNLMSVPTDCDQRDERLGWMGDADLTADSFSINFEYAPFQDAFLRSMVDAQGGDGSLPDVVPFYRYGGDPGDVSWSAAFPQNVFMRYKINGDLAPAAQHWSSLMLYLSNLAEQLRHAGGSIRNWKTPYGDWVPAGPKVTDSVCTGFSYIVNTRQMLELAVALNKTDDAAFLRTTIANVIDIFNRDFYKSAQQCYDNCGQSSYALALVAGVNPGGSEDAMVDALVNDIVNTHSNHVTVGIIGAKALFQVLKARNKVQVGIDLAEQTTQPSWGYMIFNDVEPATSNLWELWDSPTEGPGMNSRNHHMFSSISEFIVTSVSGIDEFSCRRLSVLRPAQTLGISWADTTVGTECGPVHVAYRRTGTVQCAKVPEGRSDRHPLLPVVDDVVLSCGAEGGVISSIDFAAWGQPYGTCGAFAVNASCDAPGLLALVQSRCEGRSECALSSRGTDWPTAACAGPHRLFVQATCSGAHGVNVDVTIPVGQTATELRLPHHGAASHVVTDMHDGRTAVVVSNGVFSPFKGIRAARVESDAVVVTLGPGSYALRLATA